MAEPTPPSDVDVVTRREIFLQTLRKQTSRAYDARIQKDQIDSPDQVGKEKNAVAMAYKREANPEIDDDGGSSFVFVVNPHDYRKLLEIASEICGADINDKEEKEWINGVVGHEEGHWVASLDTGAQSRAFGLQFVTSERDGDTYDGFIPQFVYKLNNIEEQYRITTGPTVMSPRDEALAGDLKAKKLTVS